MGIFNKTTPLPEEPSVRLREEDKILGFIDMPKNPNWHKFLLTFIAAGIVLYDIFRQLPVGKLTVENMESVDPSTWIAFPFILFASMIAEKEIFRKVCSKFRHIANTDGRDLTEHQLFVMSGIAMRKLILIRIFTTVRILVGWFLMFNIMLIILLYFKS